MKLSPAEYDVVLRNDFLSFAERAFHELHSGTPFDLSAHVELMAAELDACRRGEHRRLIINVPPRHLKSHLASTCLPAWYLGHHPAAEVVCVSYGQALADDFARDTRRLMESDWYERLFPTRVSPERRAANDFFTIQGGSRLATSVGGAITGRGADIIIIDDPIKPEDALSEPIRTTANRWYENTLLSRLNNKMTGVIVIVMQRLHQDDLVGHVLEHERWRELSLPALALQDETHWIRTPLGSRAYHRRVGEPLCAKRENLETLADIRRRSGNFVFMCQYQQSPIPFEGNLILFDWLRRYEEQPARFSRIVQSWDTANKPTEFADFSVCTTWGVLDKYFYLLDVYRERLNFPELKRKVVELQRRHNAMTVVIEDKASGTSLIQDLEREIHGIHAYKPAPGSDKAMRLHVQADLFENGFVLLPTEAPWLDEYIVEITGFPGTRYDDQVDSTTQALDYMRQNNGLEIWTKLGEGPDFPPAPNFFPLWGGPRFWR